MIVVTGANGKLGQLVFDKLLEKVPAGTLVAAMRTVEKGKELAARGVQIRQADYDKPETLVSAFAGADQVLLISSSEVGKRAVQHAAVLEAAKKAGVKKIVYTSLLHADKSALALADEHKTTEAAIQASGLSYALLRNGWYGENYAGFIPMALAQGALIGAAGEGRISSASRKDYAEAAVAVLVKGDLTEKAVYELAGSTSFTLAEFAAVLSEQSGKKVVYQNMTEEALLAAFVAAGLPEGIAGVLADSDAAAAKGGLFGEEGDLERLIGHKAATVKEVIAQAL